MGGLDNILRLGHLRGRSVDEPQELVGLERRFVFQSTLQRRAPNVPKGLTRNCAVEDSERFPSLVS